MRSLSDIKHHSRMKPRTRHSRYGVDVSFDVSRENVDPSHEDYSGNIDDDLEGKLVEDLAKEFERVFKEWKEDVEDRFNIKVSDPTIK